MVNIEEIEKRKDEFVSSLEKFLIESKVREDIAIREMNELDIKMSQNLLELLKALS